MEFASTWFSFNVAPMEFMGGMTRMTYPGTETFASVMFVTLEDAGTTFRLDAAAEIAALRTASLNRRGENKV